MTTSRNMAGAIMAIHFLSSMRANACGVASFLRSACDFL